ncbi:helix-turn-helix domain-containing protein [Streptomyces sp. DSM 44915]|uniref:Helix-turn-helix domain-containing protein n=1 Tax=Streptomyces chisholmiae TaxID=3075540 RepID=A0ABU2JZR5_9ACTN|nr:helix-turn-helix domain-containing protein [Streptomyces sp. DSM 44915]MDT0270337.1 helix-turn-helix domain-containing protein [Streptomyces sp. DSM 44915]
MRVKESTADGAATGTATGVGPGARWPGERRQTPLRVDAQRNLRHVLSAARAVFGEQGYGAPMEEVARRARVGVGTVYRRFPNKEALVRYIAAEETQRLTERAREALAVEDEPWRALAGFVQRSAAAGAGRLLPPELLTAGGPRGERVPQQRTASSAPGGGRPEPAAEEPDVPSESSELLAAVEQLVERTRAAGQLRPDVTVADLLLVIATTPPRLDDPTHQTAAEARLLEILLQGLRASGR